MKLLITIITVFLINSCAKNAAVVLPEYSNVNIKDASLLVIFPDTISLINKEIKPWGSERANTITNTIFEKEGVPEHLNNEDSLGIYLYLFNQEFPKLIKNYTYLSPVILDSLKREIVYNTRILNYINNWDNIKTKIKIRIPVINNPVKYNGFVPDYILFLDNFNVSITNPQRSFPTAGLNTNPQQSFPTDGSNVMVTGSGSWPGIWHKGNFLIWDNYNSKMVAYGKINSDIEVKALDKEGFLYSFKSVILYIFNNDLFLTKSNFGGKSRW